MDDQKEKVEAQLCEFVDGALVGPERQVIEEYLRNNPSLSEMVDDLIAHRRAVQALPREKAPVFMGEDVYGQLERQALLASGLEESAPPSFRIRRWPQLLSAAAIIVLAVGLGMFVYFMLPPKNPAMPVAQTAATLPSVQGLNDQIALAGAIEDSIEFDLAARDGAAAETFALARTRNALVAPAQATALAESATLQPSVPSDQTIVITVTADDVSQANQELVEFLSTNGIAWSAQSNQLVPRAAFFRSEPAPAAVDESRNRGLIMEVAKKETVEDSAAVGRIALKPNPIEPAAAPAVAPVEQQAELNLAARPQRGAVRRIEREEMDKADVREAIAAGNQDVLNRPIEIQSRLSVQSSGVGGRVIMAKNISAKQLHELTRSLSRPERERLAGLASDPSTPPKPATVLLGAPIAVLAEAAGNEFSLRADRKSASPATGAAGDQPADRSPTLTLGGDIHFLAPVANSEKQLSLIPQQFSALWNFGSYGFSLTDGREDGARLTGRINLTPSTSFFGPLGTLGQIGLGLEERPFNCVFVLKDAAPAPSDALKANAPEE